MQHLSTALLALATAATGQLVHAKTTEPTTPQVQPVGGRFQAAHGLPAFSLRLGNDTASVCNSSTPGISGYIDSDEDESHMFFWFFESKNDPSSDPLILWMSGGPGASSAGYGNLMELGPCRIVPGGGHTIDNPFGWNKNASLLFVDQPVSVGFSTGKAIPHGLAEASAMMDRFMRQFIVAFPQMASRDFYIAGESYGGSWVPALAATIQKTQGNLSDDDDGDSSLVVQQSPATSSFIPAGALLPRLRLKGIMIGNGLVRLKYQSPGSFEAACSGPNGILSPEECISWAPWALWCEQNIGICETAGTLSTECTETHKKCMALDDHLLNTLKRNPYNWAMHCDAGDMLECFPELPWIDELLNRSDVKAALGVDEDAPFRGVSYDVWDEWQRVGDTFKASDGYVNQLLDSGVRVLIYVGDRDFLATAAGMRRLVNEGLAWKGHPLFRFRELMPWYHGSKVAGRWKGYAELTYAEVSGSGHLTPFDLPGETLSLINGWLFEGRPPPQ